MNKSELIKATAQEAEIAGEAAKKYFDALIGVLTGELQAGNSVDFGIGKFSINRRSARKGVNPQTGATIQIAASNVVKFKAGKRLKETVNA